MLFGELEDLVKDAILEERTSDPVLRSLIEIAIASIENHQPVFQPLDEPVLFRRFLKWVREGLKEAQAAFQKMKETTGSSA